MEKDARHAARAIIKIYQVSAGHAANGSDTLGHAAGQPQRHASTVREPIGIDALRVDGILAAQFVDQIPEELQFNFHSGGVAIRRSNSPTFGETQPRRIDYDEVFLVRQLVPLTDLGLVGRPLGKTMDVDYQWHGLLRVVRLGNEDQIFSLLPR